MITKLIIISLLFASAFSAGAYVEGVDFVDLDTFKRLHQIYPDFVIMQMSSTPLRWDLFKESYQNALDAGYTQVHMSIRHSLLPLHPFPAAHPIKSIFVTHRRSEKVQPGSLPDNFTGRVWIIPYLRTSYHEIVSLVEGVTSQGYQVGVIGDSALPPRFKDYVPSVVSSLPLAWLKTVNPFIPFAGWNCPSILIHTDSEIKSLTINDQCL